MEYELLDCGNGYKVERFGKYILARPEPQAFWNLDRDLTYWSKHVDAYFERRKTDVMSNKEDSGTWIKNGHMPNSFIIKIGEFNNHKILAKLSLTSFKHVGIFPEQYSNWMFLRDFIIEYDIAHPILNLFAYTGIVSIVGAAMGSSVVHVDSVKQVVNWSNENRIISEVAPKIAWVIEDVMKYVKREVHRKKKYSVIILDPPAYGRGPNGEKWILEHQIFDLLNYCKALLDKNNPSLLIINLYSMNISPKLLENILKEADLWTENSEVFEQTIPYSNQTRALPLGICGRVIFN